jgi:hypothetical protein
MSALFASPTKDHSASAGRSETEPWRSRDSIASGTAAGATQPKTHPLARKEEPASGRRWQAEEGLFDRGCRQRLARPLPLPTHNFNALKHHICRNITCTASAKNLCL